MSRRVIVGWLILGSWLFCSAPDRRPASRPKNIYGLLSSCLPIAIRSFERRASISASTIRWREVDKTFAGHLPELDPAAQAAPVVPWPIEAMLPLDPAILELLNSSANEGVRAAAIRAAGQIGRSCRICP